MTGKSSEGNELPETARPGRAGRESGDFEATGRASHFAAARVGVFFFFARMPATEPFIPSRRSHDLKHKIAGHPRIPINTTDVLNVGPSLINVIRHQCFKTSLSSP